MKAVLTIAGSDCSGGAGIQADLKTIAAHHLYGESAITALTAQNTTGVFGVEVVDPAFIEKQIDAVYSDIRPDAVKVGMLPTKASVSAVAKALIRNKAKNIVIDPVMVASSGADLVADDALKAAQTFLFPMARIITPNIPEAEALTGIHVDSIKTAEEAATKIATESTKLKNHVPAVLVKGGHADLDQDDSATDLLRLERGALIMVIGERVPTTNTHGTGCTLSAAIACRLAEGYSTEESVRLAKDYVRGALKAGLDLGAGSGPLDHMWQLD